MQCTICQQHYSSQKSKQPLILINCGHTFCSSCIQSSHNFKSKNLVKIECFQCKTKTEVTDISQLPVNIAIQKLYQPSKQTSLPSNFCTTHKKAIEAYCQDDQYLLCIDCIVNGSRTEEQLVSHKGHELLNIPQTIAQLQWEANTKKNEVDSKYTNWGKEMNSQIEYKRQELETMKEGQKKQITEYFTFLRLIIEKQEQEQMSILEQNYKNYSNKLSSIKERINYFELLQQDYVQLYERAKELLEEDQVQYIRDFQELRDVGEKIDKNYECETTFESQEILNSDLDYTFDKLKYEDLLKSVRSQVMELYGKSKSLTRQMTLLPSRASMRKSYEPLLSERKENKPKFEEHPLQVELVSGNVFSRDKNYQTSNSLNNNMFKKSTSSKQFLSNSKQFGTKMSNMATFSKYLTKTKIEVHPFSTFKSKNCSPRGVSFNKASKKKQKQFSQASKIKIEPINTTTTNTNKSVNKYMQSSEASVNISDGKTKINLGDEDNKIKIFTPLCTFKKAQRCNPKQLLDHSSSLSIISTSSKRNMNSRDILSPLSKKAKQQFSKQVSKTKSYLNQGRKLVAKSPCKYLKKKSAVFSSFEDTLQHTNQLSTMEFKEKSLQEPTAKSTSQDFLQEKIIEGVTKTERFDYKMNINRNPFKEIDMVNTQHNQGHLMPQFQKCTQLQKFDIQQLSYKVLDDDTQSEDSIYQYPSFNQFNDDYNSKSSSTLSEFKTFVREEKGKHFIVKESIFKNEEVEIEGVKIKQVLKMKQKKSGQEVKLIVLDENDLIYGIVVDEDNQIHKQLIINQEIENELCNTVSPQAL